MTREALLKEIDRWNRMLGRGDARRVSDEMDALLWREWCETQATTFGQLAGGRRVGP